MQELATKAEIQVAYAIGVAQPISIKVETFGTGNEKWGSCICEVI